MAKGALYLRASIFRNTINFLKDTQISLRYLCTNLYCTRVSIRNTSPKSHLTCVSIFPRMYQNVTQHNHPFILSSAHYQTDMTRSVVVLLIVTPVLLPRGNIEREPAKNNVLTRAVTTCPHIIKQEAPHLPIRPQALTI